MVNLNKSSATDLCQLRALTPTLNGPLTSSFRQLLASQRKNTNYPKLCHISLLGSYAAGNMFYFRITRACLQNRFHAKAKKTHMDATL